MTSTSTALQLKEEGNAFFVKKDLKNAHYKYTEAIALDGQNAVLYANRSACSFGMKNFLDASRDARRATELDPGYAKGWSRRACADEALLDWKSCVESWEKALDVLPKTDLSSVELKQKEQYSASLRNAKHHLEEVSSTPTPGIVVSSKEKLPWQMASEMLPELRAGPCLHLQWSDARFRFEAERYKTWMSENLEVIKKEAQERQKTGWDKVRPALSVTVRAWIMRAIFDHSLRGAPHVSVELLKQTLDLLEWGRQTWKDVSREDRGSIFQDTFVRGVRSIYLEALMEAYAKGPGVDKKALLDTLFKEANHMILETQIALPHPSHGPADPGLVSSFYVYPVAQAHASLGFYHARMAESSPNPEVSFLKAGIEYSDAAMHYPEDDEYRCFYLQGAIRNMLSGQQPIDTIEANAKRLRDAIPKMQKIWANSALAKQGRDAMIQQALDAVEERLRSSGKVKKEGEGEDALASSGGLSES